MPELGALPSFSFAHLAGVDPLTINNLIVPVLRQSGISNSLFVLVHRQLSVGPRSPFERSEATGWQRDLLPLFLSPFVCLTVPAFGDIHRDPPWLIAHD